MSLTLVTKICESSMNECGSGKLLDGSGSGEILDGSFNFECALLFCRAVIVEGAPLYLNKATQAGKCFPTFSNATSQRKRWG